MSVDETIMLLLKLGFMPAGETSREVVRIPRPRNFIARRTIGGRARYALLGTDLRVTVGPRTTNVYYTRDGSSKTEFVLNERTRNLTAQGLRATVTAAAGR